MNIFQNIKFTDKKHTTVGIMSFILGIISLVSVILSLAIPCIKLPESILKYGFACVVSVVMAIVGIVLGIIGKINKASYGSFSKLGLILNSSVIVIAMLIIMIGVLK